MSAVEETSLLNVFITDPHLKGGGQVRYVTNLARELVAMGHTVTIGCKAESVLVDAARRAHAAAHSGFAFRGGMRPLVWGHDIRAMMDVIRRMNPDVIHVSGSQDHWVAALANRFAGRPVCLVRTRHNTYPVSNHWPNRVLNRHWTDYQIVVCDIVRRDLARQSAFDPDRMCSIHNGVDAERFTPDPETRADARREFGYSDDQLVLGIAARLVRDKGHRFLLDAFAQLVSTYPNLRLLILGEGKERDALEKQCAALAVSERVIFAGYRDDMDRCVQAFDIGVQPSIDCDTSSFSLKEQMALEIPVVASDYGGLPEIVDDGAEGFVVPAGTVDPLAKALETLIKEPDLRARMGQAGRQRVLRDFTVQVFAQRTAEAYQRAIEIHRERTTH